MKQAPKFKTSRKTDRERIAELDLDSLSEAQLRALYEEIFGEPSDEEIAEALHEAEAEYKAGDYSPTPLDIEDDDEPYREPTRQEILQSLKQSYKGVLAGNVLTAEQFQEFLRETSE
ncbi:MAG: hypothetical protein OXI34_02685 [Chloroflexota bacterium]|nr:hypothetical protein [Chloroflexota bacterium]MDE2852670.1 hypothetical protein [Chloroflexota bacterium]MDE2948065.1 hypothetical protein [Chloroflexota bacterium]